MGRETIGVSNRYPVVRDYSVWNQRPDPYHLEDYLLTGYVGVSVEVRRPDGATCRWPDYMVAALIFAPPLDLLVEVNRRRGWS